MVCGKRSKTLSTKQCTIWLQTTKCRKSHCAGCWIGQPAEKPLQILDIGNHQTWTNDRGHLTAPHTISIWLLQFTASEMPDVCSSFLILKHALVSQNTHRVVSIARISFFSCILFPRHSRSGPVTARFEVIIKQER
ncbi:hypothetical protein VTK73DRAFT_1595 [Phialemonium thermophilum]|uniref:Uncharacterized protein n=1 Tax=Phialemonium thermophilum TaxID=223376 RepID=A0ABR3Y315_9PEZI